MASMQIDSSRGVVGNSWAAVKLSVEQLTALQNYQVVKRDGSLTNLMIDKIADTLQRTCVSVGLSGGQDQVLEEVVKNLFHQIKTHEVVDILILSAASLIEKDPIYSKVAARFLLQKISKEVQGSSVTNQTLDKLYRQAFIAGVYKGVEAKHFDARLADFDLNYLSQHIVIQRDYDLEYLGLQTLHNRYLVKLGEVRLETVQAFWMRIAMGLAINEPEKNERAI